MFDVQADLQAGQAADYYTEIAALELEGQASRCDLGTCGPCPDCAADVASFEAAHPPCGTCGQRVGHQEACPAYRWEDDCPF